MPRARWEDDSLPSEGKHHASKNGTRNGNGGNIKPLILCEMVRNSYSDATTNCICVIPFISVF
jgi:hypothetical protein